MTSVHDDDFEEETKPRSDEFARMLEDSFSRKQKKLSVGDKIRGEVLVAGKENFFVSTGTQNDGIVPRKELLDSEGKTEVKVGDVIDLFVTQVRGGEIYLSPKPTAKNLADDLEDAFDMMIPVDGRVAEVTKGGFRVALQGNKLAFCPISQMDSRRIEGDGAEYVGKRFEFRITQFSEGGRNIVVSRRKLLDEQAEATRGSFLEEHHEGDIVAGRIARLEKFGAFVELGPGIDGLAHVSELSWSRVEDPAEVVKVGQEVQCKVLKIERGDKIRISLSIKRAGGEPWDKLPADLQAGSVVDGKVTRCMKFGAFVELAPGIEGLIPLSEMSYTKRVMRSDELVKEGDRISVKIKDIDTGAHRISLSLKDAGEDPWAMVHQKFPVGKIVPGKVVRREGYGLFVQLEDGVTALLPKSKAVEHPEFPFEKLRINDPVTVMIGEIRQDERRISLTVPQDAGADDWKGYVAPEASASSGFGTLGDKLKLAMEKKSSKK